MIYISMFVISSYVVTFGAMVKYAFDFFKYVFDNGYVVEEDRMDNIANQLESDNIGLLIPGYNVYKLSLIMANKERDFSRLLDFFRVCGVTRRMTIYEEKYYSENKNFEGMMNLMCNKDIVETVVKLDEMKESLVQDDSNENVVKTLDTAYEMLEKEEKKLNSQNKTKELEELRKLKQQLLELKEKANMEIDSEKEKKNIDDKKLNLKL